MSMLIAVFIGILVGFTTGFFSRNRWLITLDTLVGISGAIVANLVAGSLFNLDVSEINLESFVFSFTGALLLVLLSRLALNPKVSLHV